MPPGDDPESGLIDRIYEAAIVPESWPEVLRLTAALAGCKEALFGTILNDEARLTASSLEFGQAYTRILEQLPIPVNERALRLMGARHVGFITDRDVFTEAEIAAEPLYQEMLIPSGYGSGVATAIAAPSGEMIVVHCERGFAEGTVGEGEIAALNRLRPHFARAGLLARRLDMERARAASTALAQMGLPGAVLGADGRIVSANGLIEALMPAVFRDRLGRLVIVDAVADQLLGVALAGLAREGHDAAVRSIPIPAGEDRPPIIVHLSPVSRTARDVFANSAAILVATPVQPHRAPGADIIEGLFDLTPAEARLAVMIAEGLNPPQRLAAARRDRGHGAHDPEAGAGQDRIAPPVRPRRHAAWRCAAGMDGCSPKRRRLFVGAPIWEVCPSGSREISQAVAAYGRRF